VEGEVPKSRVTMAMLGVRVEVVIFEAEAVRM
jgi:hypothetical protein